MKWYYMIIGEENRVPRYFLANDKDIFGRDRFAVCFGRGINDWNSAARLNSTRPEYDGTPDDVLANALGWPVFSNRLRQTLRDAEVGVANIQYLPIRVIRSTGEEVPGFEVANVVTRVAALDRRRSRMLDEDEDETDPETGLPNVTAVGKAALFNEKLVSHDVIRLVEYFPPVFVSQRFVDAFNTSKCTGATFAPTL